jgi:hypothetical protein
MIEIENLTKRFGDRPLLGRGDRLPHTHPAAAYRGAFGDNDLLNGVAETVSAAS